MKSTLSIHVLCTDAHLEKFGALLKANSDNLLKEGIQLLIKKCDCGDISLCRAQAMESTDSEYLGWIDVDDVYVPGSYTKMLNVLENAPAPFIWMNERMVVVDDGQLEVYTEVIRWPHHMHLIHRDEIDWPRLRNNPDRLPDWWVRMHESSGTHLDEIGYIWRRQIGGYSFTCSRG